MRILNIVSRLPKHRYRQKRIAGALPTTGIRNLQTDSRCSNAYILTLSSGGVASPFHRKEPCA
jgi:hypothetical protein